MSETNGTHRPQMSLSFSAQCDRVEGQGWACMIDGADLGPEADMAVGHVTVTGGPNNGRFLAVVCARHATEAGYGEVKDRLVQWMVAGLLSEDLGPGVHGAPEVLHRGASGWHWDPLPEHRHDEGAEPPG